MTGNRAFQHIAAFGRVCALAFLVGLPLLAWVCSAQDPRSTTQRSGHCSFSRPRHLSEKLSRSDAGAATCHVRSQRLRPCPLAPNAESRLRYSGPDP